ncbi:hypothetical protein [Gimesia panareensis]|uniref:hypothetical protein n=1 Tax=Gimesia panareensis TaxID=2527978 RepID=UPI00118CCF16|nr:hypothetical protein [Gimesia panareensis]QDU50345.1 hypothetical protein Pan110_26910 [Gimesia panareensis]
MKLIGYWIGSLKDDPYLPPQAFVGGMETEDKELVADYLDRGVVYRQYRGYSWCRFSCGVDGPEIGSSDLTDGEWVWPQGLSHYIRRHDVRLPDFFVEHVRQNQTKDFRALDGETLLRNTDRPSSEEWVSWCRENVHESYLKKREHYRVAAERAYEELRETRFRDMEGEVELSTEICRYQGCTNLAMKEKFFCVRCATKWGGLDPGDEAWSEKFSEYLDDINS